MPFKSTELSYCNIRLLGDNIICCAFTKDVHYTMDMANEMFDAANALLPDTKYYLITVMHVKLKPQKEVFDFYADTKREKKIIAEAFCLNSAALKLMANFYFRVKRPNIPSRVFETEADALSWINTLR
ncbi:MAG: hypothetical protein IT236_06660 [Bacteroidia bacterium]|nr:hypothetical protein [Bacteroidia bacterium]